MLKVKLIVKELEQAIFGYEDDKDKEELEETEEIDKRFKNLISKKRLESFKEYSKKAEYIDPQVRVNALRKKLNNLPETSHETSDETTDDNNNNNDNDDSEDNRISYFVDRVLKKVSKEIVNDDNKNDDNKNDDYKKLLKLSKENADLKKKQIFCSNQIKVHRKILLNK